MNTTPKSFKSRQDIPPDYLAQLNQGQIPTRTLVEALAMDFRILLCSVIPERPHKTWEDFPVEEGILKRMMWVGSWLAEHEYPLEQLSVHPSDTVRGWVAYALCHPAYLNKQKSQDLESVFQRLIPLADDPHFGVREWAWLAIRPSICKQPQNSIDALIPWTAASSENIRRFASEATRPRGVWCAHIHLLKTNPELALPLLTPLNQDPSKYVQDSVANWLNDAGKTQPYWVKALCEEWLSQYGDKQATQYIVKRATRNLKIE
jgi:3-methyladenine DNA glycosylase AlkC